MNIFKLGYFNVATVSLSKQLVHDSEILPSLLITKAL